VIGSRSIVLVALVVQHMLPQHEASFDPSVTWRAAALYLSFTISRTVSGFTVFSSVFMIRSFRCQLQPFG